MSKRLDPSFKHFLSNTTKNRSKLKYKLRGSYVTNNFGSSDTQSPRLLRNRNPAKSLNLKSRNKKESMSIPCSHASVERYKSRGYAARSSLLASENVPSSPLMTTSKSRLRYTNSVSNNQENSFYKKIKRIQTDIPLNLGKKLKISETLQNKEISALKELQPVMMSNKDMGLGNSRNTR